MRVPHVNERIKEAPAQALRGMFAGIGQLLLVTDKLRNKGQDGAEPAASAPVAADIPAPAAPAASAAPAAAAAEAAGGGTAEAMHDPDKTGNVRLLTDEDAGPGGAEASAAKAPAGAEAAGADPAAAGLPLPTYDDLSVASLRARLRTLTATQVGELAAYEKANAARPEVIAMFERRIAKLAAESAS
jgi:hypothetical protein